MDIGSSISSSVDGALQTAGMVSYQLSWYTLIILGICLLAAFVAYLLYLKSFNIDVIVIRTGNGIDFTTGLKGKFYLKGKGDNEYRFKIRGARKHKLLYNEEAISSEHVKPVEDVKTKKVKKLLFLSPDSEGFLKPYDLRPETYEEMYEVLLASGEKQPRKRVTTIIKGEYGSVDVSWIQNEAQKWKNLFDTRGFLDKWGTIIILIGMILVAGALLYTAYKFAAASENMDNVLRSQSELINTIIQYQNATIGRPAGQVINTITAT